MENVIRCPVLLAGGDVIKFILPEMYPGSNDNQNENLTKNYFYTKCLAVTDVSRGKCAPEGDLHF